MEIAVCTVLISKLEKGQVFRYIGGGDNWYRVSEVKRDKVYYIPKMGGITQSNSIIHGSIKVEVQY